MVDCLVGLAQIRPATVWYHIYRALPATDPSHFQQSLVYQLGSTKHHRFLPRCFIHFTPRILTISTSHRKIPPCILNFILCHQHLKFSHCVGLCLALFFVCSPSILIFGHISKGWLFTSWNFFFPACNLKGCKPKSPAVSTTPGADNVTAGSSSSEANWRERERPGAVRTIKIHEDMYTGMEQYNALDMYRRAI